MQWFEYVDKTVTIDLLNELIDDFLIVFDKSPAKLKNLFYGAKEFKPNSSSCLSRSSSLLVNKPRQETTDTEISELSNSSNVTAESQREQQCNSSSSGYSSTASSFTISPTSIAEPDNKNRGITEAQCTNEENIKKRQLDTEDQNGSVRKICKLENHIEGIISDPSFLPEKIQLTFPEPRLIEQKNMNEIELSLIKNKMPFVPGFETNPEVISCLLKESLKDPRNKSKDRSKKEKKKKEKKKNHKYDSKERRERKS